jgi:SAM-dependent methyltransferase
MNAAYVCLDSSEAVVARLEPAAREVRWSFAIGTGGRLAAAAAPFDAAPAETERLVREGLFAGRGGFRATPDAEARYRAAMLLFKLAVGFQGVDAESRKQLWPRAVIEMGSLARLVESSPRLFSEVMFNGDTTTWTLTPKGVETFGSLKVRWPAAQDKVFAALGRVVRPGGVFASGAMLDENIHQAEQAADDLLTHYLWPHLAGFAVAHPRDRAPPPALPFPGEHLELDRTAQRLRLRP